MSVKIESCHAVYKAFQYTIKFLGYYIMYKILRNKSVKSYSSYSFKKNPSKDQRHIIMQMA